MKKRKPAASQTTLEVLKDGTPIEGRIYKKGDVAVVSIAKVAQLVDAGLCRICDSTKAPATGARFPDPVDDLKKKTTPASAPKSSRG